MSETSLLRRALRATWNGITRVRLALSNILFLVPVVALILGWWVLGEVASPVALLGSGLAISGLLVRRRSRW